MTSLRHILALNIRERRRFLGYSQVKLAEIVDTASTYIAMIELERRSPSFEMLERIAAALNMDPPELFSMRTYSVDLIKEFHESVLKDFQQALNRNISKFDEGIKQKK